MFQPSLNSFEKIIHLQLGHPFGHTREKKWSVDSFAIKIKILFQKLIFLELQWKFKQISHELLK